MQLGYNIKNKKIRAEHDNGETVFIQISNVKTHSGHEGECLTSCDLLIEDKKVGSWEILDMGGGTMFRGVEYVGELEEGRFSRDIDIEGIIYNSDYLEDTIQTILDCHTY